MKQPLLPSLLFLLGASSSLADPQLTSWFTDHNCRYARIYETTADAVAGNSLTSWTHPNGGNSQLLPAYSGVHEISHNTDWVFLRSSGLGSHVMGPWYRDSADPALGVFVNYPGNTGAVFRIPRVPVIPANPIQTGLGAIGIFVDGVAQFDSRDAFSYSLANAGDAGPGTAFSGDGHWNRDAYVNEGQTFDPANAHQAGATYHYHANPAGLRELLEDSVTYQPATHTYTETPNGNHSPIIGWCSDGLPIYGPYGYSVATNASSAIARMRSGYQKRDGTNGTVDLATTGRVQWPAWADRVYNGTAGAVVASPLAGPVVSAAQPLGHYIEDYAYLGDLGMTQGTDFDLDEHNARWCVTPEFPAGTWAYFVAIEANGTPKYPYNIGRTHKARPTGGSIGDISEVKTVHWQGGTSPDKNLAVCDQSLDTATGDFSLTWSALEGGEYVVEASPDLTASSWSSLGSLTSAGAQLTETYTDAGAQSAGTPRKFYRVGLDGVDPYDSNGYAWRAPSQMMVTFPGGPNNLNITPTVNITGPASISGPAFTRLSRFVMTIDIDPGTLAPGVYTVSATYPGAAGTQVATYVVADNTATDNVLLVILDDWGIDSSGLYNSNPAASLPPMPTMQGLASNGVLFQNAYSQPACGPTRATMITGRYSFRHGVGNPAIALDTAETTIAEVFGNSTSHYQIASFGKWHLSGGGSGTNNQDALRPRQDGGWPYFEGSYTNIGNYATWEKIENDVRIANTTDYPTTEMTDDVIDWIDCTDQDRPWFAWAAYHAPHDPYHAPPTSLHSYTGLSPLPAVLTGGQRRPGYEAALEALDTEIGRLLASVDLATTNVIVIGDNGTPAGVVQEPFHTVAGRAHAKGSLYEGGTRVPLLIAGPAVSGGGRVSSALVHCTDIFSTVLEMSGLPSTGLGPVSDSVSLVDVLANNSTTAHSMILVETFGNAVAANSVGRAVYDGTYKVIEYENGGGTGIPSYELYHIPTDENEETDLNDGSLTAAESAALTALQNALATDTY